MIDYPPLALFIGGRWRAAEGRDIVPVRNPGNGEVIGELPCARPDDLDEALASAARGHEQWRQMPAVDRGRILQQAAALIIERRERIAGLITLELGKPIAEVGKGAKSTAPLAELSTRLLAIADGAAEPVGKGKGSAKGGKSDGGASSLMGKFGDLKSLIPKRAAKKK